MKSNTSSPNTISRGEFVAAFMDTEEKCFRIYTKDITWDGWLAQDFIHIGDMMGLRTQIVMPDSIEDGRFATATPIPFDLLMTYANGAGDVLRNVVSAIAKNYKE